MIKNRKWLAKLSAVVCFIFVFTQIPCDVISAAEEQAGGTAKEWTEKAGKESADGRFDEAILSADQAIRIDPNYEDAYFIRGYARSLKKLFDKAVEDFDMVIKLKPDDLSAYINRGSIKSSMGLYDGCIEDQTTAISLALEQDAPPSLRATIYYRRAIAYRNKGEYDPAIRDFSRYIELMPYQEGFDGFRGRALAYEAKGEIREAIADINNAVKLKPEDEECKQELVKLEESAASAKKAGGPAQEWADKAAKANADCKWDEAISYASMAIKADPNDPETYFERGRARYEKDILKEAVEDFDKAIKLKPDYVIAYHYRGRTKANMGLLVANVEDQNMVVKLAPDDPASFSKRGVAYHWNKQYDLALADYNRSIEMSPDNSAAYRRRGDAYYRKGDNNLALWDYDKANKLNPKEDIYFVRGRAYFKKGDYDAAIADYSRALEENPVSAGIYNVRAEAYRAKGQHDLAIKDYNRSIELSPEQKEMDSYFGRGMAYEAIGDNKKALEDLKKAVALKPANEEFKQELKKTEKNAAAGPSDESPEAVSFSPVSSGSPVQAGTEGARVLTPFTGYALDETCEKSNTALPGVPWGPGTPPNDATVASSELGQYEALLRHNMQVLRLVYGSMTAQEEKSFDAFWAPFFDHPTTAGLEYFKASAPLLDEMAVTLNNIDGLISNMGVGLEEVLMAGTPDSVAGGVAAAEYESLKAEKAKINDLVKKINALGNPPNPLAAKCKARKRHRKALGGLDIWALLRQSTFVGLRTEKNTVAGNITYVDDIDKPTGDLQWKDTKFTYSSKYPHFDNPAAPWCYGEQGQPQWGGFTYKFEGGGEMSKDGMSVIAFHGVLTRRSIMNAGFSSERVDEEVKNFNYENLKLVLYKGAPVEAGDRLRLVYSNVENPDLTGQNFVEGSLVLEFRNVVDKIEIDWAGVIKNVGDAVNRAGGEETSGSTVVTNKIVPGQPGSGVQQGGVVGKTSADPEKDPQVIKEAIDQHLALAAQARRDADRWAKDARSENNNDRRKELDKRAAEIYANAQTEQDIADSLRTGTMVHTRTEWDERQHEALVKSVKDEIAVFAAENKLLANIPKAGNMVGGAEGVEMREETQKRITEAIKSPDRLQKLQTIYSGLQNKVVQQGDQEMSKGRSKVDMWEDRIAAAENVQFAASTAIMFATLWNPAQIGSLALGFAGATGFAEGGVKGATVAVTRSVSSRADVVISAYEGAMRIDPATNEPAGTWGAIEGALWSIGTNKAFETLGGRLQKAKANYALYKQGAGGRGVKAVAKATGPARLKEYDFKTPEQRYKTELSGAKTPEQKAEINKKYAIQAEREKMNLEMEGAKLKAENDVRKGLDPAKAKENYNKDLNAVNEKYKSKETRNQEHQEVMEKLGFDPNKDIKPTGSAPKNAASDMDFTPEGATPHEAYQKGKTYVEEMQKRGHSVDEYGDRWVDNTNDSTIWKPGFGADKPGSSSFDAEVIFGTLPNSDKFGTKGGIEWTSSQSHTTDDPLGAVLANAGKAAGAGLGNSRPKDLHTIGKSAVKAAEAAGVEVDPQLKAQIDALKAHQTPEQAGIVDLGADQATKDKQVDSFLRKVESLMGRVYGAAKAKSDQKALELEQKANASGNSNEAYDLRSKLGAYKAGNDAAFKTIAQASPRLGKVMAPAKKAPGSTTEGLVDGKIAINLGGLSRELFKDREEAAKAPAPPADPNDPAFAGLGKRCKEGAKLASDKLAAAKPGSDEAKYLAELKGALERGEKNPAEAVRTVRGLSGTELSAVLAQLGVSAAAEKK